MNDDVKNLIDAVGALAEMSLALCRAALRAGATPEETWMLLNSFMREFHNSGRDKGNSDG